MKQAGNQPTSRQLIASLRTAIQTFQSVRHDLPINMVVLFLLIAERGRGIGAGELARLSGASPAAVSRHLQALGRGTASEQGLGLIRKTLDPNNTRAHSIALTKDGRALADKMETGLAGSMHVKSAPLSAIVATYAPDSPDQEVEPFKGTHWENWVN